MLVPLKFLYPAHLWRLSRKTLAKPQTQGKPMNAFNRILAAFALAAISLSPAAFAGQ